MKKTNGQISLEFIIMTTAIIVFSISILTIISYYNNMEIEHKSSDSITNFIEYLQNEIILAAKLEDGYIKNFELPEKINNNEYSINISHNDLTIEYEGKEYIKIVPEVTGQFNIPNNTIRKMNNEIFLN